MSVLKEEGTSFATSVVQLLAPFNAAVRAAQTADDVIAAAATGLEANGLWVAFVERQTLGLRFRWLSDTPVLNAVRHETVSPKSPWGLWLESSATSPGALWVRDAGRALDEWLTSRAQTSPAVAAARATAPGESFPAQAMVLPLHSKQSAGAVVLLHDAFEPSEVTPLELFGAQLGSALEVLDLAERNARQGAELELVYQLAALGPRADASDVAARALRSVCRSTQSQAAALHRYEPESGDFVLIGEVYGPSGHAQLSERFRRFRLPMGPPLEFGPAPSAQAVAETAELRSAGFEHIAIVPLFIESHPVGMLTLARSINTPYSDTELRGAEVLGVQMASLLERARLYDEASQLYIDLKRSYDQLARTQAELVRHERLAALGELAAVMAHEVRNPLGVIFNSLTTLKRLLRPTGDAEMLLTMVGEEADRLNRIVADLLDFARPYELTKKPIAIEPVIDSAIDAATKAVNTPAVRVVTEYPKPLPLFPIDAHFVRQALVNLLVNAVQAMPKGGTVNVSAFIEVVNSQSWLVIDVRDDGVGLTPRAAEKMFQPFFTTKATGTGLGLAVVKRIVDAHQGEVSAKVNDSGHGTTFRCRFPYLIDRHTSTPSRGVPAVSVP